MRLTIRGSERRRLTTCGLTLAMTIGLAGGFGCGASNTAPPPGAEDSETTLDVEMGASEGDAPTDAPPTDGASAAPAEGATPADATPADEEAPDADSTQP